MGRQYLHTPTMDALAANGMVFTRAYSANPLCMPLRNSLFTGRYPHETRVTQNAPPQGGLDPKEFVCMGTYFRNAGYETAYSGKWHLCFDQKDPNAHGFEIRAQPGKGQPRRQRDRWGGAVPCPQARQAVPARGQLPEPAQHLRVGAAGGGPRAEIDVRRDRRSAGAGAASARPGQPRAPKNEPDSMTLIRRAYQVEDGLFPVAKFTRGGLAQAALGLLPDDREGGRGDRQGPGGSAKERDRRTTPSSSSRPTTANVPGRTASTRRLCSTRNRCACR